jgi:hypothetical protein
MASLGSTQELVGIGSLLSNPQSYQLHNVILHGAVKHLRRNPPRFIGKCGVVYDSFTFTLEDETGSIEVDVRGHCSIAPPPSPLSLLVSEGEIIDVQAYIYGVLDRTDGGSYEIVRALASKITHSPN